VDEKTGIQALERISPDLPMQAGKVRRQEYEYKRHGTQCLIANLDVVSGQILSPSVGSTRTEQDFCLHLQQTVQLQSELPIEQQAQRWCFVLDNLNTHQSESLVRWIAEMESIDAQSLGEKGKSGILKDQKTRAEFLSNPDHKVYFVYTPKHCSWLNQIEIWFAILTKKRLKHGSFKSEENLKEQILLFIEYYNRCLAKPFKWTFGGKPLA
jgi:putative transposase